MTQTGAISDGGQFEVQGDGGVTLTNASNNFDDLSVSSDGGSATVRDANSVNLRAVEVTGSGRRRSPRATTWSCRTRTPSSPPGP